MTVFIIVGIVILFTFAGILYVTKRSVKEESLTTEGEPVSVKVPQEFAPLQAYTEKCLDDVSIRGLRLLGQQGGYIYPAVLGEFSLSKPTEGVGLNLEPAKVPYWFYNANGNDAATVALASLQPKLFVKDDPELSIEAQLGRFVREKIDDCLENYDVLRAQGFDITVAGDKDAEVRIGEESINVWLKMSVVAQKEGAEATLDRFLVKVPLRLKHYYEVAEKITQAQEDYRFLERQGMELISIYSRKDPAYFAPTSDVTYDFFSVLSWNEQSLKENFVEVLVSYVPLLRYLGSENFYYSLYPEGNLLAQRVIDNMVLPLTGAEDLAVSFDYFGWDPYFKANSENGVIKPDHVFVNYGPLSFGTQRYDTHYDASYPVLVTIRDDAAFAGQGYDFVLALESNIRNNKAAERDVMKSPFQAKVSPPTCNEEHRDTELLKTVVVDSETKEPLEAVRIGYSIPDAAECEIGVTDIDGEVESRYPAAYGGELSLIKPEYLVSFYPLDTYKYQESAAGAGVALIGYAIEGAEAEKAIELHKFKAINVTVKKRSLQKCVTPLVCEYTVGALGLTIVVSKDISCTPGPSRCFFNDEAGLLNDKPEISVKAENSLSNEQGYYLSPATVPLSDTESATLILERVGDLNPKMRNQEYSVPLSVTGAQYQEVSLVPGIYRVSGTIYNNKQLVIPSEERCTTFSIVGWDTQECFTIDGSTMDKYLEGSVEWDTPQTFVRITPEDLYASKTLEFTVVVPDYESVPETMTGTAKKCGSIACLPEAGCIFSACVPEDITINSRVIEDLQVAGETLNLMKKLEIRSELEPVWR